MRIRKKLMALGAALVAFVVVFTATTASAAVTVFKTCYATGSTTYRAQMWNNWTQYADGSQRPSTNTVQFQKWINGAWVDNDWVTSANADYRWSNGSIIQRVGPLNPPGRWNFSFSGASDGNNVRLRASGNGQSLDCTAYAP